MLYIKKMCGIIIYRWKTIKKEFYGKGAYKEKKANERSIKKRIR